MQIFTLFAIVYFLRCNFVENIVNFLNKSNPTAGPASRGNPAGDIRCLHIFIASA